MKDLIEFIAKSPTAWHAAKEIAAQLKGFKRLSVQEPWKLEAGKSYFVEKEGSLLYAFRLPKKQPKGAILLASHTDSPALKVKPNPDISTKGISLIGTEIYGGPLLHTWYDRDLSLAGLIETNHGSELVHLKDHPILIPQLAIHLDRTINEKGVLVNKQDHLRAILSHKGETTLEKFIKKETGCKALYGFDLFLVPTEKVTISGGLIAGYRIDNLTSAYASLDALLNAKAHSDLIQCAVFWNHEEIGSISSTGAGSHFVDYALERITLALSMSREEFFCLKSSSLILSADVCQGFNPNFAEKYDPQNSAMLGHGVTIKFNAGQKYASDASSVAPLAKLASKNKIHLQLAANRSDMGSGSTVGPIMSANTSIPTIDLGVPCWAMHSTREFVAESDLKDLTKLLKLSLEHGPLCR